MDKEPITITGLKNLKSELEDLKNVQRPKIVEAIAEARSHGDLKEKKLIHNMLKKVCVQNKKNYKKYKKWSDEYFYLPHRKKAR